jgi:glycosyltransferase involved in cell wall biosynthesis
MVMPPTMIGDPKAVVATWTTLTRTIAEVHAVADVQFHVVGRHDSGPYQWADGTDIFTFAPTAADVADVLRLGRPDVVHVHGLTPVRGRARWMWQLGVVGRGLARDLPPIVLQHHGEPVPPLLSRLLHLNTGRSVAGYLFTGADHGQAQPFIDAGMLGRKDRLFEVLEAASLLPNEPATPVSLAGSPSILWVGRLIDGKQPLLAIDAFGRYAATHPEAHLHLLATDRTLEPQVRSAITALGPLAERVHLHDPVPHAEMAGWYSAADVYLSTSRREGSNYSLIEAMTLGCSPAVSDIPPHRAIAGGLVAPFPIDDAAAAAAAIERATAVPRSDVAAYAEARLSWRAVAERLVEIWESLRTQAT